MKRSLSLGFALVAVLSFMFSCSSEPETKETPEQNLSPKQKAEKRDSTNFVRAVEISGKESGVVGVFDVPEMLVLCIQDSTESSLMTSRMKNNYEVLEKEIHAVGAVKDGPRGLITYNSKTKNLVFECVQCIKEMPKIQPKHSQIVILETCKMLIYNFYGPNEKINFAYKKIQEHCSQNKLAQSGPVREFYVADASNEPDPQKWLTRIFLPVVSLKK